MVGRRGRAPCILTSSLDVDDWSASHHGRFTNGEPAFGIRFLGSWLSLRRRCRRNEGYKKSLPLPAMNFDILSGITSELQ
jgi:hypothetical protein